ncbi:unnamed protein product [Mytilus coruscus]|uniref:Uncharacterized protein n=1 Tax=Mytilus coruscus TaxID=42192 RepID=A0A6J8AVC0_MYTCO|nr:unnamed protein product [Mytilus coruscus]
MFWLFRGKTQTSSPTYVRKMDICMALFSDTHHQLHHGKSKSMLIVHEGRQHLRTVQFFTCEEEAETLLRFNLWPSSPKHPRLAFHIDLLCLLRDEIVDDKKRIYWSKTWEDGLSIPYDGVPFIIVVHEDFECHHGQNHKGNDGLQVNPNLSQLGCIYFLKKNISVAGYRALVSFYLTIAGKEKITITCTGSVIRLSGARYQGKIDKLCCECSLLNCYCGYTNLQCN